MSTATDWWTGAAVGFCVGSAGAANWCTEEAGCILGPNGTLAVTVRPARVTWGRGGRGCTDLGSRSTPTLPGLRVEASAAAGGVREFPGVPVR